MIFTLIGIGLIVYSIYQIKKCKDEYNAGVYLGSYKTDLQKYMFLLILGVVLIGILGK